MNAQGPDIPWRHQVEALAHRSAHALLKSSGIDALDIKPYFSVSRRELIAYLTADPDLARSYLLQVAAERPFHDHLVVQQRGDQFVIYDMDHGKERDHLYYNDLFEAVADYLAFGYAYGFAPD